MKQRTIRPSYIACIAGGLASMAAAPSATTQPAPAARPATTQPGGVAAGQQSLASDNLSNLSLDELMNITVTSVSRAPQSIADAPSAITVITQDDIQRSGLDSIPELLRLVPGMDVQQVDGNKWAISARGFSDLLANKLQVLQDGRTVYLPSFGGVYWDSVDYVLADLDRIEVIRGPGATIWGADAVNGVVNITSKSADQTQGLLLDSRGGNLGDNTSVRYGGQIDDRTYYRVYGKFSQTDDFKEPDGSAASDSSQSELGGFRIDRFSTPEDILTFQGDSSNIRSSETNSLATLAQPYATGATGVDSSSTDVLGRWTHTTDSTSDFALQLYYDRYNREEYIFNQNNENVDLDFHDRFPLADRQEITWGAGSRLTIVDTGPKQGNVRFNPSYQNGYVLNAFAQDDITLIPNKLHGFIGSKIEQNNLAGLEVQPSGRLLWTPDNRNTVWAAVSRAVRTPSFKDRYVHATVVAPNPAGGPPLELDDRGDPDFESEELTAYELGYRSQATQAVSFDVSTFYNQYHNLTATTAVGTPTFSPVPVPHININTTDANEMSGATYGCEVAVNWKVFDNLRLAASYSLLQSNIHSQTDPADAKTLNGTDPVNQAQIHSYLNITPAIQFNTGAYYIDHLKADGTPAYVRLDFQIAWRPRPGLELNAGVQNVLDSQHREGLASQLYLVPSEVPLSYYAGLTWKY